MFSFSFPDKDVSFVELYSNETVHYIDLISRDVYLPLLTCNLVLSDQEKDRFLDLFHRLLNQTAAIHTFQSDSIVLPLPAFNILSYISQQEPHRQQMILSILENTLTNWSKQIKVRLVVSFRNYSFSFFVLCSISNYFKKIFNGIKRVQKNVQLKIKFNFGRRESIN